MSASEYEYVDGEFINRDVGDLDHSATQGIVAARLYNERRQSGVHVFLSLTTQVSPTRYRISDIAVTTQKARGRILREPPLLCIEILSPEDRASRMEAKIDDYLAFGVRYVWVIDPRQKKAWSYTSEGRRESPDVLRTSGPDLALSLEEVFAAADEDLEE